MYGLGMAKGFGVTLKNLIRKPTTIQYPEQRNMQHTRFRGQEFTWYEDRCTGCASCAKYCPLGTIKIETNPEPDPNVVCPEDGGLMIPREGKYGLFYGCENYPKCKGITKSA